MEVIIINLLLLFSFVFEATTLTTKDNPVLYSICNSNETVSCSSQIPLVNGTENDCFIEPSPICLLEKPEIKNPAILEKEASYSVSILPILSYSTYEFLSFNISLKTSNSEVTGLYFYITQKNRSESKDYTSCRKFNFKEARKSYQGEISLDYDCYRNMESPYEYYNVIIKAYPLDHHKDLVFRIYTPKVVQIEPTNICDWNPLRMINSVALQRNIVELKFSPAPEYFKVERYFVFLNTSDGQKILAENLEKLDSKMYRIVFEDVPMGTYILNIIPINSTANLICPGSKTNISVSGIGNFNHQFIFAIIICGSLVVVVLLGFIMHKLCHRLSPRGTDPLELPRPKVMILYSYDCSRHFDVVLKFVEYLKSTCNMDVTLDELDMGEREHVTNWISETITASQFVVIIISRGVHHKAESKNKPPMKEPSPFGDRFIRSLNLLMDKVGHGANNEDSQNPNSGTHVIKVIFDYSSRRHVPSTLFKIGPSFYLMNQINEFLCQILAPQIFTPTCMVCRTMNYVLSLAENLKIHCQQSKVFPIKIYPKMPGSDFMATTKGKELVKAIEDMRAYQKEDPLWFSKTQRAPEEESSGAMERVEEETKEALEKESDDNAIQLNYDNNRKPSPSYSGKSVTISLNEEKSPECQVLLEKSVKDETV